MCEHEFVQEEWIVEVCKKCDKLRAQTIFDDELAATNARIASYEQQFGEYCKWAKSDMDYWKQRAEKAEAQCAAMRCCGNCINWINRPEKMSCKIHEIDVARWCRCGEWQVKEVPPCSE